MSRSLAGLRLLVASLLITGVAVAQPRVAEPAPADAAPSSEERAQVLFAQARALMLAGSVAQACPLFEESQRLEAGLGTQFNLAACHEALGRLASAHALFTQVLAAAVARGSDERARMAKARAEALEPRLSKLSIVVPLGQRGRVEVERDGLPVSSAELGLAVPVDAGIHTVRVLGSGLAPWSTEIRVPPEAGEHTVLVPDLTERTLAPRLYRGILSAPPRDEPRIQSFLAPTHRKVAVAAGSMGLLGVSAGTILGLRAISKGDESVRRGCVGRVCPTTEGVNARRQAQISTSIATVAMIAGLTGLATSAALFLLVSDDRDDDGASSSVAPRLTGSAGELLWRGTF